MRLFIRKEARGVYGVYRFADEKGPCVTVALFRKEIDARRFADAGNRSMTNEEEKIALTKMKGDAGE